ncbi:MAG TPA: M20/M25/M40 family metallo-hydrolase [Longimicrobiaceae bacterium]|nr:M20/M25/M40 family metallo-hydrolase [Longimicrobiaceae bacterium]
MPDVRRRLQALRAFAAALALLPGFAATPAGAQTLTPQERRIVAYVDAHTEEAVALLARLVDVNSGTMNAAGVREVGRMLAAELDSIGFETRWVSLPDSLRRAGHLFAEHRGSRGKRVLLIGHLDTVFEQDDPFQRFVRYGNTLSGPGVSDMKGGDVVIVYALRALAAAGALEGAQVIVAMTGDEEDPGLPLSISRADLVEAARRSDAALEFEGGSRDAGKEYAVTARRSSTGWTLRVGARGGHSSGIFSDGTGSGAVFEAARILSAFHEELRGEQYLTFNPGVILGGTEVRFDPETGRGTAFGKTNVIAATAVVAGDLRTLTDEQLQRAREAMRHIVAQRGPQTTAAITFSEGYPSMPPTEGNRALLDRLNEVNRALGLAPMEAFDPGRRGAADISFVAPYVSGIGGLGVHGGGSHTERETMDLASFATQVKRAALLIYRLTR